MLIKNDAGPEYTMDTCCEGKSSIFLQVSREGFSIGDACNSAVSTERSTVASLLLAALALAVLQHTHWVKEWKLRASLTRTLHTSNPENLLSSSVSRLIKDIARVACETVPWDRFQTRVLNKHEYLKIEERRFVWLHHRFCDEMSNA